jgi:hypothetical protein
VLTPLIVREMQIKTTMRSLLTPVRMAMITKEKRQEITDVNKGVQGRVLLYAVGDNVNWCSHYGNQYDVHQKIKTDLGTGDSHL